MEPTAGQVNTILTLIPTQYEIHDTSIENSLKAKLISSKSSFTPSLKPQIVRAKAQFTLYNPQISPIITPMSNARRAAQQAAILLAAYTRDTDLDDASFSRAADNAAQYYGADVSQTLTMFDNLTADEYLGCTAQKASKGAPWQ